MAINYTYDRVVNGVTDASADYMNNIQEGLKASCDGVDRLELMTNATELITYHQGCVNVGNTYLIKKGNVVTLHLDLYCEGGFDGTQYLTLPQGYMPLMNLNTGIFYATGQWGTSEAGYLFIDSSGPILLYSNATNNNKYCHGTITYIV